MRKRFSLAAVAGPALVLCWACSQKSPRPAVPPPAPGAAARPMLVAGASPAAAAAAASPCPAMAGRVPPPVTSGDPRAAHAVGGGPVALIGRFAAGQRFAWGGTAVAARFSGTGASLILGEGGTPRRRGAPVHAYDVSVDGGAATTLLAGAGRGRYVVAAGLPPGPHRLEVRRRTDAGRGITQFGGIEVAGGEMLPAAPRPPRRVLFLGDGLMAGARLGADTAAAGLEENAAAGYALRAAAALGADAHLVAAPGRGILRNAGLEAAETMPLLAARVLPQEPVPVVDPHHFVPQAVVIDLGRADYAVAPPTPATFVRAYQAFVRTLRHAYPDARLYCVALPAGGPHDGELAGALRAAVEGLGDRRAELLALGDGSEVAGDAAAHGRLGAQLAAAVGGGLPI